METIEQVREEKKQLLQEIEALLAMISAPVLVVDHTGDVIHTNSIAEYAWQCSQITLGNKNLKDLVEQEAILQFVQKGKPANNVPVTIKDAAGGMQQYQCRVHPLFVNRQAVGAVLQFTQSTAKERKDQQDNHTVRYSFADIRGHSQLIESLKTQAAKVAMSDSTILIRGESGTGKEVLAQAIHGSSPRKNGRFVALNCAAIPESLLESELFGYEEGAFTGAKKGGKAGRFEMACGGTLFLDEIGDMPLFLQAKLLRVLQERRIERIGGSESIPIDVRVITATHKDLAAMIAKQQFREDLYFRLNVIPLFVPPLRERKEDLYDLTLYFMKKYSKQVGKETKRLSSQVLQRLYDYHWPGNVRELENVIEYVVNLEIGDLVTMTSLPGFLRNVEEITPIVSPALSTAARPHENEAMELLTIEENEQYLVIQALRRFGMSAEGKRKAAESLGISRATLYRRLQAIQREKKISK